MGSSNIDSATNLFALWATISFDNIYLVRVLVLSLVALISARIYMSNKTKSNSKKTVPYAKVGMFKAIRKLGNDECPWFLLELAREAQKNNKLCYRLPIPMPGGFYVICDAELQRKIFIDSSTDKSAKVNEALNKLTGSSETISTSTNNEHWKLVRKSSAQAFAIEDFKQMKEVVLTLTKEWCDKASVSFCDNPFDPSHEMVKLTFKIICVAGFEYNVSDEEFEDFSKHVKKHLKNLHQNK